MVHACCVHALWPLAYMYVWWRPMDADEREPRRAAVHDAAFASRGALHFTHADAAEEIERMPQVYLWLCSPSCQPFTPDNQSADIATAIAEFRRTVRYVRLKRPSVAIVEEVAAVTHDSVRGTSGVIVLRALKMLYLHVLFSEKYAKSAWRF